MPYREFRKNSVETVRVAATKYQGHDLIDIRVFARIRGGEVTATRKGVSVNVDQVPDLIESLEWALQQACTEDSGTVEESRLTPTEVDRLALETHKVLAEHGLPVHWDLVEKMILGREGMERFTKWQLHYVLVTRRDLFAKVDTGCFRAV